MGSVESLSIDLVSFYAFLAIRLNFYFFTEKWNFIKSWSDNQLRHQESFSRAADVNAQSPLGLLFNFVR